LFYCFSKIPAIPNPLSSRRYYYAKESLFKTRLEHTHTHTNQKRPPLTHLLTSLALTHSHSSLVHLHLSSIVRGASLYITPRALQIERIGAGRRRGRTKKKSLLHSFRGFFTLTHSSYS